MRIAEFRRSVPLPRDRVPRHGEVVLVPAENGERDPHDDEYAGESEEHEEDVEADEAEPVAEGAPPGGESAGWLVSWGAVGRGCGRSRRKRIAAVVNGARVWQI